MSRLELKVVDVTEIPGREEKLAIIEILSGEFPGATSIFVSPDIPGKWQMTEVGTHPPEWEKLPIGFKDLVEGNALRPGIRLVQDTRN